MKNPTPGYNEARRKSCVLNGELHFHLELFGDELANREKYKEHHGIDAIYWYLIERYKWTPATVKALNTDDLRFLMAEEMSGWTLPVEARG